MLGRAIKVKAGTNTPLPHAPLLVTAGTMRASRSAAAPPVGRPSHQPTAHPSLTCSRLQRWCLLAPTQPSQQRLLATLTSLLMVSAASGSCYCCGPSLRCSAGHFGASSAQPSGARRCGCRTVLMAAATRAAAAADGGWVLL